MLAGFGALARSDQGKDEVKEKALDAPNKVKLRVRMEGPYTADVPLQVVCYFKYTPEGATRMSGAPVELDKRLGGVIASLRGAASSGGPTGDDLLTPPRTRSRRGACPGGLGDEDALSLNLVEGVGRVALREAARLGVSRVGFAPRIRDQGNTKIGTGDVETAVVRGMLLSYDTEKRLQKEGLGKPFTLEEWWVEAGPPTDETVAGVKASAEAADLIKARG
jgi:hypothetical protein